ncbi:PREDICTED: uncharacterized protein LOC108368944 [Rhagoletis zephyria]|uniref:uncharacterized protein LOC108368944 n=1 Tax=Rhagoletis zephyria TaxID=28612 RepID=UPI00081124C4|nr:PREDICTED: uncharacterized protein LOC108368944 [Rhagoletis zephyria]
MSELFMDMQQCRTAALLTNAKQHKSKHRFDNDNNNDIYSNNNKCSFSSSRTPDTNCSSQRSTTTGDTPAFDAEEGNDEVDDEFANVLSLQLRKPKHWRWELSTARSCANIALPRILLYDHKGQLLVDANSQLEQCYKQPQNVQPRNEMRRNSMQPASATQPRARKRANKAATTNLAQSIRKALDRQFSGLQIQEATPSPACTHTCSAATTPTTEQNSTLSSTIDFYTNDLPDYKLQRRANSLKGVRFKVNDDANVNCDAIANKSIHNSFNLADLPTPPSTITTTTTPTNSSSSGPREKRRYRRSHSSGRSPATSESILERFSFNKGRFSSPEFAEEHEVYHAPRYFLRTSKAGTLVVQHESFSRYRRRRRLRNSSTENGQSTTGSGSKSSLKMSESGSQCQLKTTNVNGAVGERPCGSLLNMAEQQKTLAKRKTVFPVRRYRSDGNVLLHQRVSSSGDEQVSEREDDRVRARERAKMQQSPRKYVSHRIPSKKELVTIDPENGVQPGAVSTESR